MDDGDRIRKWQFCAEDETGENFYLDEDNIFIGNSIEADTEGDKRCARWESETGGLILRLELISLGKVKS